MIRILTIGLGIAVLGLNLIIIWAMLKVTAAGAKRAVEKLILKGVVTTILGFLVAILGWCRLQVVPAEGSAILMAGSQIALLGLAWILRVIARGNERNERYVREWARIVVGIGVALILAYGIVVYVCPLFCS
jgi:hypothetical protein